MTRQLLRRAALVILLVLGSQASADQGERNDNSDTIVAGQLRGTWVAVSMERRGQKEEVPKGGQLTFAFDVAKVIITEGTHTEEWSYQHRDGKTPWEIDLSPLKGQPPGMVIKGIYRIDGDTLKFAFSAGGTRPTVFAPKDDDSGVITFKRKK